MSGNSSEIQILQSRVSDLERENAYLKRLLEQAGIPYELNTTAVTDNPGGSVSTTQSGKMPSIEITYDLARRYFSYFWGRMDVYSKRSQNRKTGKSGYYPQCEYFWRRGICPKTVGDAIPCKKCHHRKWKKLSPEQIIAHLEGKRVDASDVIGVYPLFPDGTCRFLVFDFDCHTKEASTRDFANLDDAWIEEVNAMRQICAVNQIPALVERSRSGKGAHLWIFFDHPMDASLVRRFGFALLDRGAESVNLKSFQYYDRMLPAQDSLSDEQSLGNLIALPLQGQALKEGNSAFIDENWIPYQITDQRTTGREISVTFTGELRQNQEAALQELLKYDCGILSAATAFGKTVVCTSSIARKAEKEIVISSPTLGRDEDVNDNIMRVASREIAAELLEMTFQKENTLKEYE